MEEFQFDTTAKWLKTTEQQFQILKTIYRLEDVENKTMPKSINNEYARIHKKKILKPNLFNILKTLLQKNLIKKDTTRGYRINYEGIRITLENHQEKLEKEEEELKKAQTKTEEYFRKNIPKAYPLVEYYDQKELYPKMAESLKDAEKTHIVANFPVIAYTKELTYGIGREEYAETMWNRCFKEKELQVNYLTDLNLDALFNHAFRVHGDPKLAYRESETTLNRLETQTKTNEKLDIRYSEDPHGLDMAIVEHKEPTEFYLFIRDEHGEITGGIRIKNKQTTINAIQQYNRSFEYAEKLNTPDGQKTIQDLKKHLKQKYGILD
jgi:hypothetical protein